IEDRFDNCFRFLAGQFRRSYDLFDQIGLGHVRVIHCNRFPHSPKLRAITELFPTISAAGTSRNVENESNRTNIRGCASPEWRLLSSPSGRIWTTGNPPFPDARRGALPLDN